jgi:hypothetical protein
MFGRHAERPDQIIIAGGRPQIPKVNALHPLKDCFLDLGLPPTGETREAVDEWRGMVVAVMETPPEGATAPVVPGLARAASGEQG